MSCWDHRNNAICQHCGAKGPSVGDRHKTIEFLRAKGWHHSQGVTHGLVAYEAMLCRACVTEERKRALRQPAIEQDALPLDWDSLKVEVKGDGYQSR